MNIPGLAFAHTEHWPWVFAVALLIVLMMRTQRIRRQVLKSLGINPKDSAIRAAKARPLKAFLVIIAGILLVVTLMGPQFGQKELVLRAQGLDICIGLDLSPSMLAEDVSPSRLGLAKNQLSIFLPRLGGDQASLVGFAGSAYIAAPLTIDQASLINIMTPMNHEFISDPSTNLESALSACLKTFKLDQNKDSDTEASDDGVAKVIALVSDGEDSGNDQGEQFKKILKLGIPVYTFGVGLEQGSAIPVRDESGMVRGYLRDPTTGKSVSTKLESKRLQELANESGGHFFKLSDGISVWNEFEKKLSAYKRESRDAGTKKALEHRFQIPLLLAFLLLLIEFFIPETGRIRRSKSRTMLGLLIGLISLSAPRTQAASSPQDAQTPQNPRTTWLNNSVEKSLSKNDKNRALKDIQEALETDASNYYLRFNWATTQILSSFEIIKEPGPNEEPIKIDQVRLEAGLKELESLAQDPLLVLDKSGALNKERLFQKGFGQELLKNFDQGLKDYYQALALGDGSHPLNPKIKDGIERLLTMKQQSEQQQKQNGGQGQGQQGKDPDKNGEYTQNKNHQGKFSETELNEAQAKEILESVQGENTDVQKRKAQQESKQQNDTDQKGQSKRRSGARGDNMKPTMKRAAILTLSLLSSALTLANTSVFSSVTPEESQDGQPILFKIRVVHSGQDNIGTPQLPTLKNWRLLNSYQSPAFSSLVIVNGRQAMQKTREYSFVLQPLKNGTLPIPSVPVQIGSKTLMSDNLSVKVTGASSTGRPLAQNPVPDPPLQPNLDDLFDSLIGRPSQQPGPAGPDLKIIPPEGETFFVRALPSKTEVYKGELIELSYVLFQKRSNISDFEFSKFPSFKGFLKEELRTHQSFNQTPVILNGAQYFQSELIKFALFPIEIGNLNIEPLHFKATMIMNNQDIFDQMLRGQPSAIPGRAVPQNKFSQPLSIVSKALPPPPPGAKFDGAVGQYSLNWNPPKGQLFEQQPFSLQVVIQGRGNIKALPAPEFAWPEQLESQDTRLSFEFREDATGSKTFDYLVLPKKSGAITIPATKWTYFDPLKKAYVDLSIPEISLNVEPAQNKPNKEADPSAAPPKQYTLSPAKPNPNNWTKRSDLLNNFLLSPLNLLLQTVAYLSLFVLLLINQRRQKDNDYLNQYPWERTARELLKHKTLPADQLSQALDTWTRQRICGFLKEHDPYSHPQSARAELLASLRRHCSTHFDQNRISALQDLWRDLDLIRFSGRKDIPQGDIQNELKKTRQCVE